MSKSVKLRIAGKEVSINLDTVIKMENAGQYKTKLTTTGISSVTHNTGGNTLVLFTPYEIYVDNSIEEILKM